MMDGAVAGVGMQAVVVVVSLSGLEALWLLPGRQVLPLLAEGVRSPTTCSTSSMRHEAPPG